MIDNQTAIMAIKKLAEKGGVTLTPDDVSNLNKHHSLGKNYKERNNEIRDAMFEGFFLSASNGELFIPEEEIKSSLGKSIEQNYPEASESFLKFAKTYWSLRVLISKLNRDDDGYISFIGGRILGVLEGDIGPVFFPFPGPQKIPPWEREAFQRELLKEFAPNIDVEDFIQGNPILIRDRKAMKGNSDKSGCLIFLIISVFILTLVLFI